MLESGQSPNLMLGLGLVGAQWRSHLSGGGEVAHVEAARLDRQGVDERCLNLKNWPVLN